MWSLEGKKNPHVLSENGGCQGLGVGGHSELLVIVAELGFCEIEFWRK